MPLVVGHIIKCCYLYYSGPLTLLSRKRVLIREYSNSKCKTVPLTLALTDQTWPDCCVLLGKD